jgi:hypothetical protein
LCIFLYQTVQPIEHCGVEPSGTIKNVVALMCILVWVHHNLPSVVYDRCKFCDQVPEHFTLYEALH